MSDERIKNTENPPLMLKGQKVDKKKEEDFAALFAQSSPGRRLHPGQRVKAKVVSVSGDIVYIDLGEKTEGTIDLPNSCMRMALPVSARVMR